MLDSDVVLLGNGVASLVAANHLVSQGYSVLLLNPDDDFFQPELNEVFQMCDDAYRFTDEEKQKLLQNPWLTRFGNRKEHIF